MDRVGTIDLQEELSETRRAALLTLLADEDPAIYRMIRQEILSLGPTATAWLRPHTLSRDPALRRRASEILLSFDRQAADNLFLGFCLKHGEELDLEEGAFLLAQTQYPDINVVGYRALLDSYAADVSEQIGNTAPTEKALTALNEYLFGNLGFAGNEEQYNDPENSYLNRVLDRRTGNPINLCLVYLLLARRLRLPVTGIGLPGHFVCRFQSTAAEIYIDTFNRGKLLTKADCVRYLLQGNYSVRDDYLTPASPRRILLRICSNLHQIYLHLDRAEDATRLQRYLVALAR
ncbi:MAG TPA: transglutaminase-like domain-containing protein [Candidatus Limnocylindrales bacterium]|jgi:regulator of sirC expression with transglutaminase-like and TPR domain|nr:transglutaminase-like domain-containing protein [Candidatus Limnocylindrales bacterium]